MGSRRTKPEAAQGRTGVSGAERFLREDAIDAGAQAGVELFDTTLRDGGQKIGVIFNGSGRVAVYSALDRFGIPYVEIGWPRASPDIKEAFAECRKVQQQAKLVAFGATSLRDNPERDENLRSIIDVRPDAACIFGKSWIAHVTAQLGISTQANLDKIGRSVELLRRGVPEVFYDAEHYLDGYKDNPEYALSTLRAAANAGAERLILCDTNGGTLTPEAVRIVRETSEWLRSEHIDVPLGTHFHNDSGVAVANAFATLPWVRQVQGVMGGMGERVGNLNLSTFIGGYILKMKGVIPGLRLKDMKTVVETVYSHAGLPMPRDLPFVGDDAFTHKGGVHIDGMRKKASYEHIDPKAVGNSSVLSLNSQGGRQGVLSAARKFGHQLDKKSPRVTAACGRLLGQLREMEMRGYRNGEMVAEQYLLVEEHFGRLREFFTVREPTFSTKKTADGKRFSTFSAVFHVKGKRIGNEIAIEGGPVDAAFKSYRMVLGRFYSSVNGLHLENFNVGIANGQEESSTVRTEVAFHNSAERFSTVGVDSDILISALEALDKGVRYYLNVIKEK